MNFQERERFRRMKNIQKWMAFPGKAKKVVNPPEPQGFKLVEPADACKLANIMKVGINANMVVGHNRWGDQITKPKASPFQCPWNFIARLEKRGFKVLGRGAYSTVLAKDGSDRVIKVSRTLDNWIDYIQWGAKKGYAGNFVPRVYSWKRHTNPSGEKNEWNNEREWSVAIVERMDDVLSDHKKDMALILSLYYPAQCGNTMAKVYMEDLSPGSAKFFEELAANQFASDIAGKNVMVRKNGSLCVTDPACGSIKTDKRRLRTGELSPAPFSLRNFIEGCNRYRSEWIAQPN